MGREITIDAAGRVVVPKDLRNRLQLTAGTKLSVTEWSGALILRPAADEPALREQSGLLIVAAPGSGGLMNIDHREYREDRLSALDLSA